MATPATKKGLLERLAEGPVIGDGGFVFALEKRGYVKAGPWTPEAAVEEPEAVTQLHREFLRCRSTLSLFFLLLLFGSLPFLLLFLLLLLLLLLFLLLLHFLYFI